MYIQLVRECALGFLFWSIFQAIGPMIWFFPMFELDITGYEALVLLSFSPIIVALPAAMRLLQSPWMLGILRLCQVASLASFQAPTPRSRLCYLALGSAVNTLVLTATCWSRSAQQRHLAYWGLILGFVSMLVGRIWFTSFMPPFWNNTCNNITIAITAIAAIEKILSGEDKLHQADGASPSVAESRRIRPSALTTGGAVGCLLYVTHALYSDVHVVTRWTNVPYPDPGPMPYPWGAAVLIACVFGVCVVPPGVAVSVVWWLVGSVSFLAVYFLDAWRAFAAAIVLCIYTFSLWSDLITRLMECPPVRTLGLALLVYFGGLFFSVWTIAYNFVPLGEYTREHTGYLIVFIIVTQGLAVVSGKLSGRPEPESPRKKNVQKPAKHLLILLLIIGLAGFGYRYERNTKITSNVHFKEANERDFTALIWTYHFGNDNEGWQSLERSAKVLKDSGADFVTLLESDASKPFHGNHDVVLWLAEELGMYSDFGPSTKAHTWGNAILSRYPIVKSQHHLLPSPQGELAPAVTATVNISSSLVDFVVTHMGNDRDVLDRKLQAEYLARETREAKNPVVFLGYVTSAPRSRDYNTLIDRGNMKDIDASDTDRWCQYIMYRGLIRLAYGRITHGGLSDTEIQLARFRIPPNSGAYSDRNTVVIDDTSVPAQQLLNKRFGKFYRGHGYFGTEHRYHMATPKYFLP